MNEKQLTVFDSLKAENLVVCALLAYNEHPVYVKYIYKNYIPGIKIGDTFHQFNGPKEALRVVEIIPVNANYLVEDVLLPVFSEDTPGNMMPPHDMSLLAFNSGNKKLRKWAMSTGTPTIVFILRNEEKISTIINKLGECNLHGITMLFSVVELFAQEMNSTVKKSNENIQYRIVYEVKSKSFVIKEVQVNPEELPIQSCLFLREEDARVVLSTLTNSCTGHKLLNYLTGEF